MNRKRYLGFIIFWMGSFCFSLQSLGMAAEFPSKPIVLINPWLAVAHIHLKDLGDRASKILGQPIMIEDKPGASGTLGPASVAATARPDGYTLCQLHRSVTRLPLIMKTTYDPFKDFTYIIQNSGYVMGTAVRADSPWKTFKEFIDYAKANPNKVTYGTAGAWTTQHCMMEQLANDLGIKWINVPHKGAMDALNSLLGGHIMAVTDTIIWRPQLEAGQIRMLATWTPNRLKTWPNIPTVVENGYNYVINSPWGIGGPKGMDPKVVKIIHDAFKKSMEDPAFEKLMARYEAEPIYRNSEDFTNFMKEMHAEDKMFVEKFGLRDKLGQK